MIFSFFKINTPFSIDFFSMRNVAFIFSFFLISFSLIYSINKNLNLGIDFKGGIMVDVKFENIPNINQIRDDLSNLSLGNFEIQEFGVPENLLIRIEKQPGDQKKQMEAINRIKAQLPENVDYRRIEYVGPKVGNELKIMGIKAVIFSLLAMFIYIWFRFSGWQFGLAAVIALFHDIISTIGFFSLTQIEFNLSSIAAMLTIAGYSINDTVVVFDRIRENLVKKDKESFKDLLNFSINATLSRTIMTSVTTLIALLALLILGGDVIAGFVSSMIWGVFIGTYSSIFIASPLIAFLGFKIIRD